MELANGGDQKEPRCLWLRLIRASMSFQRLAVILTYFGCITSPSCSAKYSHTDPSQPLLRWFSDSPVCLNKAHHWTLMHLSDIWNLLMLKPEAVDTLNDICAYSWMKMHLQQDCGNTVSQAFRCPEKALQSGRCLKADSLDAVAFSSPCQWVVFTLTSYNFHHLDKWVG